MIAADERHLVAIADVLTRTIAELSARRDREQLSYSSTGRDAMDRDMEIHRLNARLRGLQGFGLDLCLGRMDPDGCDPDVGSDPVYIGRLGLSDRHGRPLLVDWRSPAAAPFFGATPAHPMGLVSRRRFRWTRGRITDYWDEVFSPDRLASTATLDDQSAFIASLGVNRSTQMRDVLGTIASDQDAIIRADSRGALVVDGGPGTGKTVVALHRAAYLLYSDPRLGRHRGGVLVVGPHEPYLAYVDDVLPGLGEEGVATCTLSDLVPEGRGSLPDTDPTAARLKSTADMVRAIDTAVKFYETPPTEGMAVETPWADLWLNRTDWAAAFDAPEPGTPHNEARELIWDELLTILSDGLDQDISPHQVRAALAENEQLRATLWRHWPMLDAADLVGDLLSVPAYLRHCAPWLGDDEIAMLQRGGPHAWTVADLPLLDAARGRLGDRDIVGRRRRREAAVAAERQQRSAVTEQLIAADDSDLQVMSMLNGHDLRDALTDGGGTDLPPSAPATDRFAGPYAHIVVDEAQDLTDAQWQMLISRCPSGSFTIVGDRAQARAGFAETWEQRLTRVGLRNPAMASLRINYRTPEEIMTEAEQVIHAVLPDANVPTSVRRTGMPVEHRPLSELDALLKQWSASCGEGIACVIGYPTFRPSARIRSVTPACAKGLEFDLVVLVDPDEFGDGDPLRGGVDRYVAMTRATSRLVILTSTG